MNWSDFRRLIAPLQKKIFLLLGRALLTAIKNTEGTQKIQVTALNNEVITDMERFQEYGFETYPFADAEVLALFLNGNREHGIAACVHDRRYRPKDLIEGEVCVYTDEDDVGHRMHFKRGRVVFIGADKIERSVDTSVTETIGATKIITVPSEAHHNTIEHILNSSKVMLGNDTWGSLRKLIDSRFQALFNAHVHSGIQAGGSNTGVPTVALSDSHMTDKARAV